MAFIYGHFRLIGYIYAYLCGLIKNDSPIANGIGITLLCKNTDAGVQSRHRVLL